jgi:hypothetical protein
MSLVRQVVRRRVKADEVATSKPGEVRTRRPKSMTRTVILQRAYEMYLDRELIHGDERLSVVLESLGYTTGAGYQIWPNQAAFRLDLQVYIAERIDYASLAVIADQLQAIRDAELQLDEHILAIGDAYIRFFVEREEFYLSLRFYAMGDERPKPITEGMRDAYVQMGWELDRALVGAFERHGRRLRDGFSMTQLSGTVTALAEGFALRHRVGPEVPSVEIGDAEHHPFSVALLAVLNHYLEQA